MKKLSLLFLALASLVTLKAQWVDDPNSNTHIANCNKAAAEVYVSTDVATGDSYVQWHYQGENGWSPWLQRLDFNGVPQWPADGIHVTTPDFATWSPGYSMTAVNGGVVTVFRTLGPHHWAVKINADGTFPWGEHGLMLFDGEGGGRSEVLSTYYYDHDDGVWALGTDMDSTFLQYIDADGTLRPKTTIKAPAKKCSNGLLLPAENGVFVVYSKHTLQGYTTYNKEIHVAGYNKNGEQIFPETLLFGLQAVGASYVHYATPDNKGGGYVYQFHNAIGGVYNTYVTHFDASGTPTISDLNGIAVHSPDYGNYYTNAYATIDPKSNDLIIAYLQKDAGSQTQHRVYVNRITETGEKPWGDGILVADYTGRSYSDIHVDAIDAVDGFVVTYGTSQGSIEAVGYDLEGNLLWNTTMSSTGYNKTISENTSGFHNGQNIVAWVNGDDGGVYGQNIGWDGALGEVTPPVPVTCDPPTDFQGEYFFETNSDYGVHLSWTAPQELPLHYNLYFTDPSGCTTTIEVGPNETEYLDQMSIIGAVTYQLTAVYEDCESEFALTPDGEDFVTIVITGIPENTEEEIVSILSVYSIKGQLVNVKDLNELSQGVYIVKGITDSGKTIIKRVIK